MDYQFITEPFQKGQYHAGAVVRDGYVAFWRYSPREDDLFPRPGCALYIMRPGQSSYHLHGWSFEADWSMDWGSQFTHGLECSEKSLALFSDVAAELDARMDEELGARLKEIED